MFHKLITHVSKCSTVYKPFTKQFGSLFSGLILHNAFITHAMYSCMTALCIVIKVKPSNPKFLLYLYLPWLARSCYLLLQHLHQMHYRKKRKKRFNNLGKVHIEMNKGKCIVHIQMQNKSLNVGKMKTCARCKTGL